MATLTTRPPRPLTTILFYGMSWIILEKDTMCKWHCSISESPSTHVTPKADVPCTSLGKQRALGFRQALVPF